MAYLIDTLAPDSFAVNKARSDWTEIFQEACNLGGTWILPERVYKISSTIIAKQDGTKFVAAHTGAVPQLRFMGKNFTAPSWNGVKCVIPSCWWIASKCRFTGIRFTLELPDENKEKAVLTFQRVRREGSSASEADMDSSIDNCAFSDIRTDLAIKGAGAINWLGRNMRVQGCMFSSGGGSGHVRSISLSYAMGDDTDGQNAETGGHRKNIIRNNTFHLTKGSTAIELYQAKGVPAGVYCHGLLIANNMLDVGGTLVSVETGANTRGLVVNGNSCFRSSRRPYIHFNDKTINSSAVITGNSFFGDIGSENFADGIKSEATAHLELVTISGNAFSRPEKACVHLLGVNDKVVISGNSFDSEGRKGCAVIGKIGTGLVSSNTYNTKKLGKLGKQWIESNNI